VGTDSVEQKLFLTLCPFFLAVYNTTTSEFEVYDIRIKSYPMYRYRLFNGNAQLVQFTDKVLLVFYLGSSN